MSEVNILLETKELRKVFRETGEELEILRGVDFQLASKEIVALTGVSGAGKSTFLNMLGALDHPTSGQVLFRGKDLASFRNEERDRYRREHVGFIFQFHHLLPEFTALENVMLPGRILGKPEAEVRDAAEELISFIGLKDRRRHLPNELSGGERQRIAVARALVNRPAMVLADEPSGNLDDRNSGLLHDLIVQLNERFGQTFLIVTHDHRLASLATRVAHMADGRIFPAG